MSARLGYLSNRPGHKKAMPKIQIPKLAVPPLVEGFVNMQGLIPGYIKNKLLVTIAL